MADDNVQIVTKQETVELLDSSGNNLSGQSALASIFDKIEQGKPAQEAIKEVMAAPDKKEAQEKKAEPKQEAKQEVKEEAEKQPEVSSLEAKLDQQQEKKNQDEILSREALRKQIDAKPAEDTKAPAEEDVPEEELKVMATDKPKTAKRIQALWKKAEDAKNEVVKTRAEVKDKADRLAELEKKLSEVKTVDPKTDAAVKQQLDELAMLRRRYELDKDPEVKSKYDDRIVASEKPIAGILTRNGAGEALVKLVEEEGGWLKFSQSSRPVTLKDGENHPASAVADMILQNLPFADRRTVEAIATEQITTRREKDRFFEEQQKTAAEFFKKKEEEAQKYSADYQKQIDDAKKTIADWEKDVKAKNDWLNEKPIDPALPADQKAALEDDNKYTKQLNGLLKKAVETKDIPGMLEVVLDSVQFYQERRSHARTQATLTATKKEVERLQGELDRFKTGARSVPKVGSISSNSNGDAGAKKEKPKSLEDALNLIEAGQPIDE